MSGSRPLHFHEETSFQAPRALVAVEEKASCADIRFSNESAGTGNSLLWRTPLRPRMSGQMKGDLLPANHTDRYDQNS